MPLVDLQATNFKKHTDLSADFSSQMNVVVGPNYSGKTSLLHAVQYALFGPSAVPGGAKTAKTRGRRNRPVVNLSFSSGGDSYLVSRSGASAKLEKNGKTEASGQASVTKAVEEVLGMPMKTFLLLRTSPQDEAQAILTLGSAKLGKLVDEITQIDLIDKVISKATSSAEYSASAEPVPTEELESEVTSMAADLSSRYAELAEVKKEYEEDAKKSAELREQVQQIRDRYQRFIREQSDLKSKRSELESVKAEISSIGEIPTLSDLQPLRDSYHKLRSELDEKIGLQGQLKVSEDALGTLPARIGESKELVEERKRTLANAVGGYVTEGHLEEELEAATKEYEDLLNKYGELESRMSLLSDLIQKSVCPTCHRPMDGAENVAGRESELNELQSELESVRELHDEAQEKRSKLIRRAADIAAAETFLAEAEQELGILTENLLAAEGQVSYLKETIGDVASLEEATRIAESKLRGAEWANKEITDRSNKLRSLQQRKSDILSDLNKSGKGTVEVTQEQVKEVEEADTAASIKLQTSSLSFNNLSASYSGLYREYEFKSGNLQSLKKRNEEVAAAHKRSSLLKKLVKYLRNNRDRFVEDTWNSMLTYATEFAQISTNGDIKEIARSAEGEFMFDEGDGPCPIVSASGVQKAIIGVGVRLALAEALNSSADFMLLDEVTAGATDEISLAMTRALAASGVQIVAVTHRHSDAAVADNVVAIGEG